MSTLRFPRPVPSMLRIRLPALSGKWLERETEKRGMPLPPKKPGKPSRRTPSSTEVPSNAPPPDDTVVGSGEFRSSADRRSGLVAGIRAFDVKPITYSNVNGRGIFEGDINLGAVAKLTKQKVAADAI